VGKLTDQCPQCLKNTIETEVLPDRHGKKPEKGDNVIDVCGNCGWRSEATYVGTKKANESAWHYNVTGKRSHKAIIQLRKKEKPNKRKRPRGVHKL